MAKKKKINEDKFGWDDEELDEALANSEKPDAGKPSKQKKDEKKK